MSRIPIVRAHPVTGEAALYFDLDRATHVDGMASRRGTGAPAVPAGARRAHAPRYAHRWRAHDVLIWDNASVQHKASGDFPLGEPRRFWRFMIERRAASSPAESDCSRDQRRVRTAAIRS